MLPSHVVMAPLYSHVVHEPPRYACGLRHTVIQQPEGVKHSNYLQYYVPSHHIVLYTPRRRFVVKYPVYTVSFVFLLGRPQIWGWLLGQMSVIKFTLLVGAIGPEDRLNVAAPTENCMKGGG